ncbi:helix-turn-helix domain-containing protein [Companilactobacillus futsaii]|jgi:hypothetical protein|uniref:Helix-turn-helix domain-containing protein n=2 Tax=Companilactobacillus futsaii TaxID=938155 RepID=A0A5B7T1P5_9LACO|nr:helix-turn-helix domain-containing protein [Companilactobacillus futsaii]QCX25758.1 helix-turn-helix domain-containing protein [Companilactobacillus futsaii]
MSVEVLLSDEQKTSLQQDIFKMVNDSLEQAKKGTGINSKEWLKKYEACNYLGVANNTFDQFIKRGLPSHTINNKTFYNRKEIDDFILKF